MPRLPDNAEIEAYGKALESDFSALGKVAHAGNHMQEELGKMFCLVTGLDTSMGMALWHSLKSDRSQRELLDSAIRCRAADEEWAAEFPRAERAIIIS